MQKQFGEIIRYKRKSLKLSQNDLSKLTGINRNYISDVECGKRNISLNNAYKLFLALGLEIEVKNL